MSASLRELQVRAQTYKTCRSPKLSDLGFPYVCNAPDQRLIYMTGLSGGRYADIIKFRPYQSFFLYHSNIRYSRLRHSFGKLPMKIDKLSELYYSYRKYVRTEGDTHTHMTEKNIQEFLLSCPLILFGLSCDTRRRIYFMQPKYSLNHIHISCKV